MIRFTDPRTNQSGTRPYPTPRRTGEDKFIADQWKALRRIQNSQEPEMLQAFLDVIGDYTADLRVMQVAEALRQKNLTELMQGMNLRNMEELLSGAYDPLLAETMALAAEGQVQFIPNAAGALVFDALNPRIADWVASNSAVLVSGVTDQQVLAIRYLVQRMFTDGIPPREAAQFLMDMVGLLPKHATAVYNYQNQLLADGVPGGRINTLVTNYRKKLLRYRAENIARTEVVRASSMGQQELWNQASERGFLNTAVARKTWVVTPDDRLCIHICLPMDGQTRRLKEQFKTGTGELVLTPPAHPSCRCGVGLVFLDRG